MIKAIAFDLDGVLADFKEIHYNALNLALVACGLPEIFLDDHENKFDGLPTKKKLKMLKLSEKDSATVSTLKQKFTIQLIKSEYKQNLDTLNALKILKNEGYRMCLCSNSVRETVDQFLEVSEYGWYFEFTLSNNDVIKAKPNPEIYNKALEKFGLMPNEILVLEDNVNGIAAASKAGCNVLVVDGGVKQVTYQFIKGRINEI